MKKFLITLSIASGLILSASASAASCDHKIILLPQLATRHAVIGAGPVALSQFLIARHLDNFPNMAVFTENISNDMTGEDYQGRMAPAEKSQLARVKEIFPNGIPTDFESLNEDQKNYLMQNGGDMLALLSGRIPNLFSVPGGRSEGLAADYEKSVLSEINSYFKVAPEAKSVILILDAGYTLAGHDDQFPSECIMTPPDLKALLSSDRPLGF